ncbi:type II toxin-antitoxin system RelB/DinJ family antitoxin [Tuanshanicoccus yangjingiae]|uniref:type II toxin-antitoxin system RelB/DinJ family antitoxin n=1 Tax=Aerococcaceae bacterium zg-252 TaxID=2796928 RepID=UPI00406353E1
MLRQLGISPSSAIQMLYHQIILHNGMPFELRLPERKPTSISKLSQEDLNIELQKALDSLASGKTYSADEVDDFISKEYGIWNMSMLFNIIYSPESLQDLTDIYEYIRFSLHAHIAANKLLFRIRKAIRSLNTMPTTPLSNGSHSLQWEYTKQ